MSSLDTFQVSWAPPVAVIGMPEEIDLANARQVREALLDVLGQGIEILIVDMTRTRFCACAGASALAGAQQRAAGQGGQVRLAVSVPIVRRLLALTGADALMPVYGSVGAALPGRPA